MSKNSWLLLVGCWVLGSACVRKVEASRTLSEVASPDSALCPNGQILDFMLNKLTPSPIAAAINWPELAKKPSRVLVAPSAKENAHFQVCAETDYAFRKLLRVNMQFEQDAHRNSKHLTTALSLIPSAGAVIQGLQEALFGDYSKLLIELKEKDTAIFIKGWTLNGKSMVTAEAQWFFQEVEGETGEWFRGHTVSGSLDLGNPFLSNDPRCGAEALAKSRFRIGSAVIDTEQCVGPDLIGAKNLRFIKIQVIDSNPLLQNRPIKAIYSGEAIKEVLQTRFYHHGGSTYFVLSLPTVQYAMRNLPTGSGGNEIEVPEIVRGEERGGKAVISYEGHQPIIEELEWSFWTGKEHDLNEQVMTFNEDQEISKIYRDGSPVKKCSVKKGTQLAIDSADSREGRDSHLVNFALGSLVGCTDMKSAAILKSAVHLSGAKVEVVKRLVTNCTIKSADGPMNIRQKPEGKILGKVTDGHKFALIATEDKWLQIQIEVDGQLFGGGADASATAYVFASGTSCANK